jgi:ankyrin repeat protein
VINEQGAATVIATNFAYTSLVYAIFQERTPLAEVILLKTGLSIDSQGRMGNTPLMWAAVAGNYELAEIFLNMGANYLLRNNEGQTAYEIARENGYRNITNLLRRYGATY